MSYEFSGNGENYSGLSRYRGLNGDKFDAEEFVEKVRGRYSKQGKRERTSPPPPRAESRTLEQRSIEAGKKAERLERQGGAELTEERDTQAQRSMARANVFWKKSDEEGKKAQQVRLPYATDPMVPQAVVAQANRDLTDNPVKIADQAAPLPPTAIPPLLAQPVLAPVPAPVPAPAPAPGTLPLLPPPGYRVNVPPPRYYAPGRPMMMGPQGMAPQGMPRPMMTGPGISPNTAAAVAAMAASYFLFF